MKASQTLVDNINQVPAGKASCYVTKLARMASSVVSLPAISGQAVPACTSCPRSGVRFLQRHPPKHILCTLNLIRGAGKRAGGGDLMAYTAHSVVLTCCVFAVGQQPGGGGGLLDCRPVRRQCQRGFKAAAPARSVTCTKGSGQGFLPKGQCCAACSGRGCRCARQKGQPPAAAAAAAPGTAAQAAPSRGDSVCRRARPGRVIKERWGSRSALGLCLTTLAGSSSCQQWRCSSSSRQCACLGSGRASHAPRTASAKGKGPQTQQEGAEGRAGSSSCSGNLSPSPHLHYHRHFTAAHAIWDLQHCPLPWLHVPRGQNPCCVPCLPGPPTVTCSFLDVAPSTGPSDTFGVRTTKWGAEMARRRQQRQLLGSRHRLCPSRRETRPSAATRTWRKTWWRSYWGPPSRATPGHHQPCHRRRGLQLN